MKFETRDGKKITIDSDALNDEIIELLNNTVPRLSYDEILDGELEKKLRHRIGDIRLESVRLSTGDDVKTLIFSLAMFNAISKPSGL